MQDPAPSKTDSLNFKDDNFDFSFKPHSYGIDFLIYNLTDKPAFMQWDRCYFIGPDGNSSKALNVDLLDQNKETSAKSTYESPIPQKGFIKSFTTSSKYDKQFTSIKVEQYCSTIFNAKVTNTSTINANSSITSTSTIVQKDFNERAEYWPEYEIVKDTVPAIELKKSLNRIKDYIINDDNLGLGISIKLNDTILDYKFNFRFKSVII